MNIHFKNEKGLKTSVLALFDKDGNQMPGYVNYHGVDILFLKEKGVKFVSLQVNHGDGVITQGFFFTSETHRNINRINSYLS